MAWEPKTKGEGQPSSPSGQGHGMGDQMAPSPQRMHGDPLLTHSNPHHCELTLTAKPSSLLARPNYLQLMAEWQHLQGFDGLLKSIPIQFLLNRCNFLARQGFNISSPGSISPLG